MDKEKLIGVYNTLCQIETKGQSTLMMAGCLQVLRELIEENTAVTTQK